MSRLVRIAIVLTGLLGIIAVPAIAQAGPTAACQRLATLQQRIHDNNVYVPAYVIGIAQRHCSNKSSAADSVATRETPPNSVYYPRNDHPCRSLEGQPPARPGSPEEITEAKCVADWTEYAAYTRRAPQACIDKERDHYEHRNSTISSALCHLTRHSIFSWLPNWLTYILLFIVLVLVVIGCQLSGNDGGSGGGGEWRGPPRGRDRFIEPYNPMATGVYRPYPGAPWPPPYGDAAKGGSR